MRAVDDQQILDRGRIVRCLVANADSLSSVCRSAMIEARKTIAAARGADLPPSAK